MLCPPALPCSPQPPTGDQTHLLHWVGRRQELLLPGGKKRTDASRAWETSSPNSLGSTKGHAARQSPATAVVSGSDQLAPEPDFCGIIKKGGAAAKPRCDPSAL